MRFMPIIGAALISTGCAPIPPAEELPPPRASTKLCNADAANVLAGRKATSETGAQALSLTGAARLRWGPPDSVFTMDYREDRVNVFYDREMVITNITCG